jgi:DNA-binding CsgD family transcriptional regulator
MRFSLRWEQGHAREAQARSSRQRSNPSWRMMAIAGQIAEALEAAHDISIVLRVLNTSSKHCQRTLESASFPLTLTVMIAFVPLKAGAHCRRPKMSRQAVVTTATRRLTSTNVCEAAPLIGPDIIDSRLTGAEAVRACATLLADGGMMGVLIDAVRPDGRAALVGVGGGAFVSRPFIEAERVHPRPGLMDRVLGSIVDGRSVALSAREIAAANAGDGLNLAVILHHWRSDLCDELQRDVRRQLMEKFVQDIRGFRMREVLAEGRDESELTWCLAGGFRLRGEGPTPSIALSNGTPFRFTVGITQAEGLASEGSTLSLLFHYLPPRLGFTGSQRRMLNEALQHRTDVEIATALGVSVSAVKKAWAGIFDKAAEILFCETRNAASRDRSTRGAQKRHLLLTYLREHPEELRP